MQNNDRLRPLIEPLRTELRSLLSSEPGVEERAVILVRLAHAEDVIGQPDAAKKTRAEAVALARAQPLTDPAISPMLWPTLAIAHTDAGDISTAKSIYAEGIKRAQKLPTAEARFYALAWLALYQASPKTVAEARATMALAVKASPKLAASAEGLSMQRSLLAEIGEFAAAKKKLSIAPKEISNTVLALGNLATKQQKAGDRTGARATLAEALKRSQGISSETERRMTREFLLGYLVQVGDDATAKKLAGSEPRARKTVAEALAERGDLSGARALSSEPSPAVVYALARAGSVAEAQKEAERVSGDIGNFTMQDEPIRMLGAIAAAQARAGDSAGASATLELARKRITDDKTFGDKRAMLYASLIESIITGGKRER